jgi:hypothetical protein
LSWCKCFQAAFFESWRKTGFFLVLKEEFARERGGSLGEGASRALDFSLSILRGLGGVWSVRFVVEVHPSGGFFGLVFCFIFIV